MNKYKTEQRKLLISFFEKNIHRTFSAKDLAKALSDKDISISSIYRNLSEMEKEGLLCKSNEKNGSATLYQYLDPKQCLGIIHLKCQFCDATFHLSKHISSLLFAVAKEDFAFQINEPTALLYGKCDSCSQIQNNKKT